MSLMKDVFASAPGTRFSRERLEREVTKRLGTTTLPQGLAVLLDNDNQIAVRASIHTHREKIIRSDVRRSIWEDFWFGFVLWFTSIALVVSIFNFILHPVRVSSPIAAAVTIVVVFVCALAIICAPLVWLFRYDEIEWYTLFVWLIIWPIGWPAALMQYPGVLGLITHVDSNSVYIAAFVLMILVGGFEILMIGLLLIQFSADLRQKRLWPDSVIITSLYRLSNRDFSAYKLDDQIGAARDLGSISEIVEKYLFRKLRTGVPVTDQWLLKNLQEVAEAQRGLRQSMLLPVSGSGEVIKMAVTQALIHCAAGQWGELPRTERSPLTRSQRYVIAIDTLRGLFVSVLPLLGLWLLPVIGLDIAASVSGYVNGVAYLWVIVALGVTLDPGLGKKVSAFKSTVSAAKGVGSGG
jgi:hypothetical protein